MDYLNGEILVEETKKNTSNIILAYQRLLANQDTKDAEEKIEKDA